VRIVSGGEEFQGFVENLGVKIRPLIVSKSLWLSLRLLFLAVSNYVKRSSARVLVYLLEEVPDHRLYELAEHYSLGRDDVVFVKHNERLLAVPSSAYAIVGLHRYRARKQHLAPRCAKPIAATSHRRLRIATLLGLKPVDVRFTSQSQDTAVIVFGDSLWYVKLRGWELVEVGFSEEDARVLRLLVKAMREFGPLKTKDAVNLISAELLVSKSEARRILQELVDKGLLVIESGYVLLSEHSYSM
jgi:hypothetical protein